MNKWFFTTISAIVYIFIFFPLGVNASNGLPIIGLSPYLSPKGCETNTIKSGEACLLEDGTSWCGNNTNICQVEPTSAAPFNPIHGSFSFSCNSCSYELSCSNGYEACAATGQCVSVSNCTPDQVFDACSNSCVLAPSVSLNYDVNNPVLYLTKNRFVGLGTSNPNRQFHIFNTSINPEINLQGVNGANKHWGIYNERGDNSLNFWGNDNWLTILRNGNVGIGTTSPNYKLDVNGTINASEILVNGSPVGSGSSQWTTNGSSIYYNSGYIGLGTTTPNSLLHLLKTSGNNAELDIQSVAGANKHWGIYQDRASGSLRFWNNTPAIEKNILTILESGNVGIGTTSPSEVLTVIGRIKSSLLSGSGDRCLYTDAQGNIKAAGSACGTSSGGITSLNGLTDATQTFASSTNGTDFKIVSSGTAHTFYLPTASAANRGLLSAVDWTTFNDKVSSQWVNNSNDIYYNNGKVGIGLTAPSYKLHLFDNSSGPIIGLAGLDTNYRGLTIKDISNNEKWFYGNNSSNNFVIRRGGSSDDLTINGAGNMGIGTSTINSKLVVDGLIKMNVSNALITSPEDVINKSYLDSVLSVSSGAGKFVGVTTNSYAGNNGAAGTGYKKANGLCNSSFSGSHVCTTYEILNTIISSSTMPTTGMFWIFNGPPAYTASANDCEGRTSVLSSSYGAVWNMGATWPEGRGMLTACSNSNQFACCK